MRNEPERSIIERRTRVIKARLEAVATILDQVHAQLHPAGGIQARTISEWTDVAVAIWKLIQSCAAGQRALDAANDYLERYGDTLSPEARQEISDRAEK